MIESATSCHSTERIAAAAAVWRCSRVRCRHHGAGSEAVKDVVVTRDTVVKRVRVLGARLVRPAVVEER